MEERLTVKELSPDDQPREKLIHDGARQLSNAELLAILMHTGIKGKNVIKLSQELLNASGGSLHDLSLKSVPELMKTNGVGEAKAVSICAAMELGHRLSIERMTRKVERVENSADLYSIIAGEIGRLDHEEFWAIYFDIKHRMLHKCRICTGGISETIVDIRLIFKVALAYNATTIAVAHNHPAGSIKPSRSDDTLTKRIADAGRVMAIPLYDHIIIGEVKSYDINGNGRPLSNVDYYSYYDNQRI